MDKKKQEAYRTTVADAIDDLAATPSGRSAREVVFGVSCRGKEAVAGWSGLDTERGQKRSLRSYGVRGVMRREYG